MPHVQNSRPEDWRTNICIMSRAEYFEKTHVLIYNINNGIDNNINVITIFEL